MRTLLALIIALTLAGTALLTVPSVARIPATVRATVADFLSDDDAASQTGGTRNIVNRGRTSADVRTTPRATVMTPEVADAPRTVGSSLGTPEPLRTVTDTDRQVRSHDAATDSAGTIDPEPDYDRKEFEKMFFDEVNHQRLIAGLKKLKWRSDLSSAAREHSEDQAADTQKLLDSGSIPTSAPIRHEGHTSGTTVVDRLNSRDIYDFSLAGENILSIGLVDELRVSDDAARTVLRKTWKPAQTIVDEGVRGWMLSATHRKNILMADYNRGGVGVTRVGDFLIVTQAFIKNAKCGYENGECCTDDEDDEDTPRWCYEGLGCHTQDDGDRKCVKN